MAIADCLRELEFHNLLPRGSLNAKLGVVAKLIPSGYNWYRYPYSTTRLNGFALGSSVWRLYAAKKRLIAIVEDSGCEILDRAKLAVMGERDRKVKP